MLHRPTWRSKTGVLFVSLFLGIVTAHMLFETPNVVGGGDAMMVTSLALMVAWKVVIEFFLGRWHRRADRKRNNLAP